MVLAAVFVIVVIGSFIILKPRWKAVILFAALFGLVFLWYTLIPPSNDRQWQADVDRVVSVNLRGDLLTIHNVRFQEPKRYVPQEH